MEKHQYNFSTKNVSCFFDAGFSAIEKLTQKNKVVIITDENIASLYADVFTNYKIVAIKAGEKNKQQSTVDYVIEQLINLHADRETFIIGVGGGVVTDVAGYVASVYMRGIKFAFAPTTILAMVDAAIGGKNGVDVGVYKNVVGVINQPEFLLYDYTFLKTLPQQEWINGFAEIIKHACIKDKALFKFLEINSFETFKSSTEKTATLIKQNVAIKCNIVLNDEFEKKERKLLNFGHTVGHAIENIYHLPHGNAVAIGIAAACKISEEINNFYSSDTERVINLLKKYGLPVTILFDGSRKERVWEVLLADKKRSGDMINFILLSKIGEAIIQPVSLHQLKHLFNKCI